MFVKEVNSKMEGPLLDAGCKSTQDDTTNSSETDSDTRSEPLETLNNETVPLLDTKHITPAPASEETAIGPEAIQVIKNPVRFAAGDEEARWPGQAEDQARLLL